LVDPKQLFEKLCTPRAQEKEERLKSLFSAVKDLAEATKQKRNHSSGAKSIVKRQNRTLTRKNLRGGDLLL